MTSALKRCEGVRARLIMAFSIFALVPWSVGGILLSIFDSSSWYGTWIWKAAWAGIMTIAPGLELYAEISGYPSLLPFDHMQPWQHLFHWTVFSTLNGGLWFVLMTLVVSGSHRLSGRRRGPTGSGASADVPTGSALAKSLSEHELVSMPRSDR